MNVQDATIFEDDDLTPFFGTGNGLGGVVVADFSTDAAHPRPCLFEVKNWSASEIDFPSGSSNLGGITLEVLDKRTDSADQGTGILTSRLKDVKGKRLFFRREHSVDGMIAAFDSIILSYSMGGGPEGLVKITLQLGDIRERERGQPLFFSNLVLFGADGAQGPAINYAAKPGGGYLLDAVAPFESIVAGGVSHFERLPLFDVGPGFIAGVTPITGPFNAPPGLLYPQQDTAGIWRYMGIRIRWRAKGTSDPWTELRDMPWINADTPLVAPNRSALGDTWAGPFASYSATMLRLSSFDEYDLPEEGQEIEFHVLAVEITPDTPMWWDGGTFGDLLKEIYDGEHSQEPPKIRYSAADMAAFQASTPPARFILTKPVDDMRAWVEKHIYQPTGYAPGFDVDMAIAPISWAFPDNTQAIPLIDAETLVPIGVVEDGSDNVINQVFFTYIRESLEDLTTAYQTKTKRFLGFLWKTGTEDVVIPGTEDDRAPWQRLVETPVRNEHIHAASIATWGVKDLDISGILARSIGGVDGSPYGGDVQDELGARMDALISEQALARFSNGAATYLGSVLAGDSRTRDLRAGQWVRLRLQEGPNYDTGMRGLRRYFQIISISDEDPSRRVLALIDGTVPDTSDDEAGTGTGGEDCLTGGTLYAAPGGAVRVFTTSGWLTNTCDHPVTITKRLAIAHGASGGTAGTRQVGGGGGTGGVLANDVDESFVIAAGAAIWIAVGEAEGEDSIIWVAPDGTALDPDVDTPPAEHRAIAGGPGGDNNSGGGDGGSGGGGAHEMFTSGSNPGGLGTSGQGNPGGSGFGIGGLATCFKGAAGGGGSYGGAGGSGVAGEPPTAGEGGPSYVIPGWNVTAGGGGGGARATEDGAGGCVEGEMSEVGQAGAGGYGAGGGGATQYVGPGPGTPGVVMVRYDGPAPKLSVPAVSSTTVTDQNQATICISETDWKPEGSLPGYRVRMDYAVGPTEPAPASGDWRLAGYLEAPGCVTTPAVPTGAKVWSRGVAEATGFLPSTASSPGDEDTPETPGLLGRSLTIDPVTGIGTLRWTANAYSAALRLRWLVHNVGDSTARPLANTDDVDAVDGEYVIPDVVARGQYLTVDVEAWEDDTYAVQGRTYRESKLRPVPAIATSGESIDFFTDVELTQPVAENDMLRADEYGVFRNEQVALDTLAAPTDNTNLNATTGHHGLLPKLPGGTGTFLRADGAFAAPQSDWTEVIAIADQDVTNSGTLTTDTELAFAVAAAGVYNIELLLIYSGSDAAVDFKYNFTFPACEGWFWQQGARTAAGGGQQNAVSAPNGGTTFGGDVVCGTLAAHAVVVHHLHGMGVFAGAGTMQFKFANNTPAGGAVSRRRIGSILRYRRLV